MRGFAVAVAVLLIYAAGCEWSTEVTPRDGESSDAQVNEVNKPVASQEGPLTPDDVKLKVVDAEGFQTSIEDQEGHVLLIDYWATWCPPCVARFPHIVELHGKHKDDGLAVVTLSLDFPEDEAIVRKFLANQQARFANLLSKHGNGTEATEAFDYDGAVPLYKLYDRAGTLRYQFGDTPETLEKGEPLENLDRRVKELLAEKR